MAYSVNKAILVGLLGKDPEIKTNKSGDKKWATMSVATTDSYKDKSGQWIKTTEWHNVVISNAYSVTLAENDLKKGSKVYVEGSIQTKKWTDKDGKEQVSRQISIAPYKGELIHLDAKPGSSSDNQVSSSDDFDDEVPF